MKRIEVGKYYLLNSGSLWLTTEQPDFAKNDGCGILLGTQFNASGISEGVGYGASAVKQELSKSLAKEVFNDHYSTQKRKIDAKLGF